MICFPVLKYKLEGIIDGIVYIVDPGIVIQSISIRIVGVT